VVFRDTGWSLSLAYDTYETVKLKRSLRDFSSTFEASGAENLKLSERVRSLEPENESFRKR